MKRKILISFLICTGLAGASEIQQDKITASLNNGYAYGFGVGIGSALLPTLLENTKMQDNLTDDTLRKGCDFLLTYTTQIDKSNALGYEKERINGCMDGYKNRNKKVVR